MSKAQLTCPICGRAMQATVYGGIEIDRCECGELWFDHGEFTDYVSRWACNQLGGGEQADGQMVSCPRCGTQTLVPYSAAGQSFHRCQSCLGISIQTAALERLLAGVETSSWAKVPELIRSFFKRFR